MLIVIGVDRQLALPAAQDRNPLRERDGKQSGDRLTIGDDGEFLARLQLIEQFG